MKCLSQESNLHALVRAAGFRPAVSTIPTREAKPCRLAITCRALTGAVQWLVHYPAERASASSRIRASCGSGIRTPIDWFKASGPAIGRTRKGSLHLRILDTQKLLGQHPHNAVFVPMNCGFTFLHDPLVPLLGDEPHGSSIAKAAGQGFEPRSSASEADHLPISMIPH
jgi:hypothetical protein